MSIWKTGRERRLTFSGTLDGLHHNYWQGAGNSPGSCGTPPLPLPALSKGCIFTISLIGPWGDPVTPASVTISQEPDISTIVGHRATGFRVSVATGFGDSDTDLVYTELPASLITPWDVTVGADGTWELHIDVEEFVEIGAPENSTVIDGGYFRYEDASAYPDGLQNTGMRFFELGKAGGEAKATATVGGVTVEATTTLTGGETVDYAITHDLWCQAKNETGAYAEYTLDSSSFPGGMPSYSYSESQTGTGASASATASGDSHLVESNGSYVVCPTNYITAEGRLQGDVAPSISFDMEAWMRVFAEDYPDSQTVRYLAANVLSGGVFVDDIRELTCAPDSSVAWSQDRYQEYATLLGTSKSVLFKDDRSPVRAWLKGSTLSSAGEDTRDWRLQFQMFSWEALAVSQDASIEAGSGGTVDESSSSLSLSESNLEGFRYLQFEADLTGAASKTLTLTIGTKQYTFVASSGSVTIDLCFPSNVPYGVKVDKRDCRFPLEITSGPYGPTAGVPKLGDDVEEAGWLWGSLERPTAVTITGFDTGESCTIGTMSLVRDVTSEVSIYLPFQKEALGWTSGSDDTYLDLDAPLLSDGKQVGPWPCRAHVVGGSSSYAWFSLDSLRAFIDYTPGWNCTYVGDRTGINPILTDDGTTKLLTNALPAGNLDGYIWTGSDWRNQVGLDPSDSQSLFACFKVDQIEIYPGCGDPAEDYGSLNVDCILKTSKLLRERAEGVSGIATGAQSGDVIDLVTWPAEVDRGSATTDSIGWYRTGTPWALGNTDLRARLDAYPLFYEEFTGANRYPARTSFIWRPPLKRGNWNFHTGWGHYHRLDTNRIAVDAAYHRADKTTPPFAVDTAFSAFEARAAMDLHSMGMVYLVHCADDGDISLSLSTDDGGSFDTPTVLISNAIHPTIISLPQGGMMACGFRYDSGTDGPGTIVAKIKGPSDWDTWSDEFTFTDGSSAISFEDDTFHASPAPEGMARLILVARKAGDSGPTEFASIDYGPADAPLATWEELT